MISSPNGRSYPYRCVFFLPGFIDGLETESITDKYKVDHSTMISALHPVFLFLVYNCSKTRNAETDDIKKYVINKNIRCKSLVYWWRHLFTCVRMIPSLQYVRLLNIAYCWCQRNGKKSNLIHTESRSNLLTFMVLHVKRVWSWLWSFLPSGNEEFYIKKKYKCTGEYSNLISIKVRFSFIH